MLSQTQIWSVKRNQILRIGLSVAEDAEHSGFLHGVHDRAVQDQPSLISDWRLHNSQKTGSQEQTGPSERDIGTQ